MPTCKSCGAQIEWITTLQGKKCPVDVAQKTIWTLQDMDGWQIVKGHESHFATCPDADQHRRHAKE